MCVIVVGFFWLFCCLLLCFDVYSFIGKVKFLFDFVGEIEVSNYDWFCVIFVYVKSIICVI